MSPQPLVTVVGAASLAAPRRNEILMTLIFPLADLAIAAVDGEPGELYEAERMDEDSRF